MKPSLFHGKRQRGGVAIIVALSLSVLIAFAGIALDLGHLYVEKTELQNATDACALAAARELTCDPTAGPCNASFLVNAENSGRKVAARNNVDFQNGAINIVPADIKFATTFVPNASAPDLGYLSRADGASPASKYVMCTAQQTGIVPWFMRLVGVGNQSVSARAVATLAPSQTNCAIPLGVCMKPGATPSDPFAGMTVGQWMTSKLNQSATGSFGWIDFTPPNGGASELANLISGTGACSLPPTNTQVGEQGNMNSLGKAWNTRFGLYKANSITTAPPDFTGYAYTPTTTSWPEKFNAYAGTSISGEPNFLSARTQHLPYQGDATSGVNVPNGYSYSTSAQHATSGTDRRLVTVPVVDCTDWIASTPQTVPVRGYACVLMLHPMSNDNGPSGSEEVWLEYRGKSSDPSSPCATSGSVGGSGSVGPLVPALVQ
jgi:Flp pilus assembly protein TadG